MQIYCESDIGLMREYNEDYYGYGELPGGGVFAIICDGMGGAKGGSTASHVAVKMISSKVVVDYSDSMKDDEIGKLMMRLVQEANTKVFELADSDELLEGMGTTIVFAILAKDKINLLHAGDSRAYIVSDEKIRQITTDHSVVQEMVKLGKITKEQAKTHPKKNIITRALGVEKTLKVDYYLCDFKEGDLLLLCTDGLTNCLSKEDILLKLSKEKLENPARDLVFSAKNKNGKDNITALIVT